MTTATISDKQKSILNAAKQVEQPTIAAIAKFLGITAPAVTGTMAALKKNGHVTIEDGIITVTEQGTEALGSQTAEQKVAESVVAKIETPSIPKAQQTEGSASKTPRTAASRMDSKASKAQAIFDEFKGEKRAVLMQKLMDETGLTKNGANTYIYNMRLKAGMVVKRGTTAAPATTAEAATETTEQPIAEVEAQETVAQLHPEAETPEATNEGNTPATE